LIQSSREEVMASEDTQSPTAEDSGHSGETHAI